MRDGGVESERRGKWRVRDGGSGVRDGGSGVRDGGVESERRGTGE